MPDNHNDMRKTASAAEIMQKRVAEKAAHDHAVHVVERWNRALAAGRGALWSPTNPGRYRRRPAVARCLLSRLPDQPRNRYPDDRPPSARVGWKLGAWLAV